MRLGELYTSKISKTVMFSEDADALRVDKLLLFDEKRKEWIKR